MPAATKTSGDLTHKFTVVWGNIDDGCERRVDYVEVSERTNAAVMAAARDIVVAEVVFQDDADRAQFVAGLETAPFDGYAIFEGHVPIASDVDFH